jgi:adenylate cyclase
MAAGNEPAVDVGGQQETGAAGPDLPDDAFWHRYLTVGDPRELALRRFFAHLPSSPRCKACAAPFGSFGGPVMRLIGKGQSNINPRLCNACFNYMRGHRGGAEITCSLMFADVRGSTSLAEGMSATEFRSLMNRFYRVATRAVFDNDGSVDKFVGDEVMAMFFPLASGEEHPAKAVAAARQLLEATGHADPGGPWLPMGAGVHTGRAWVGALGDEVHVELTAVGDAVNVTARLASVAAAGEILVSADTARAAGIDAGATRRTVELKGKAEPVEVVPITIGSKREQPAA